MNHTATKQTANNSAPPPEWRFLEDNRMGPALIIELRNGTILQANTAAAELLGCDAATLAGRPVQQLRPAETNLDQLLGTILTQGYERERAGVWQYADGSSLWLDTAAAKVGGDDSRGVLLLHDVTEHKLREEKLRNQNEQLQQLNEQLAAKGERNTRILAGMSHEIRTPMHAIMAFTELMEQEILGPLTDKQRDALENVQQAGEHLMTLLNDVIDLHRAEVGKLELHLRPVPVEELIDAVYHIIHGLAWEKQINVRVEIEPEHIIVNADERRAKQVLHNLLSNAINASPQEEEIIIQARQTDQEAIISVTDHGPGIPAEYHERIFEEFMQYDNGAQSVPSGGLGLAVSRNLVEMHSGELTVISEVGEGSTFTFTLPLAEENPDQ